MSYILEALKKAQAERQVGELPTIHAPQLQEVKTGSPGAALRKPVFVALGGMSLALAVLSVLLWRQPASAPAPAVPQAPPLPAPVAALPAPVPQIIPVPVPAPVPTPVSVPQAAPLPAPVVAVVAPPAVVATVAKAKPAPLPKPVAASPPAPAPVTARAPEAAVDEAVLNLRDLPEPIQRQIPPVVLGGYMYSKNPADRLILIDKVLRHEGEEVAPGLTLEKLQAKSAVFSYKGYRYRLPY